MFVLQASGDKVSKVLTLTTKFSVLCRHISSSLEFRSHSIPYWFKNRGTYQNSHPLKVVRCVANVYKNSHEVFFRKLEELLMKDITRKYFLLKVKSGKS